MESKKRKKTKHYIEIGKVLGQKENGTLTLTSLRVVVKNLMPKIPKGEITFFG